MKSIVTFTSNLSPNLMNWITTYSKKQSSTKREVIEQAIVMYKEYVTKKDMEQSFKKAAKDKEIIKMAEEGISDYEAQLKKWNI